MSIKLANDVKDLKEELKVVKEELHIIKTKLKLPVNPKSTVKKGK